jgi:hypothetical protein
MPSEMGGRVRTAIFDFVTPGILYPGDWVKLCPLPFSARILGGSIEVPDMSTNITETLNINYFFVSAAMHLGDYPIVSGHGTMPDNTPRLVTVKRVFVSTGDTPGTIDVIGTDGNGTVISESIIPGADGATVDGTKYFKTVTSLTGVGWVIATTADTIEIGYKALAGIEATMDIGTEIISSLFATALAVGTAGSYPFASTIAQNFGAKISNILPQQYLVAKVPISLSEPWAAACTIKGWVRYSVD